MKNVRLGPGTDETADYTADLYADGELVAFVENDGRGGCTCVHRRGAAGEVERDVAREVWIRCGDGRVIPYSLSEVADETLLSLING